MTSNTIPFLYFRVLLCNPSLNSQHHCHRKLAILNSLGKIYCSTCARKGSPQVKFKTPLSANNQSKKSFCSLTFSKFTFKRFSLSASVLDNHFHISICSLQTYDLELSLLNNKCFRCSANIWVLSSFSILFLGSQEFGEDFACFPTNH